MKICFYCDSIFTFGGVQRVLAVLSKELTKKHEITILTLDDPSLEDRTMYGLDEVEIECIFLKYPKSPIYEFLPSKAYSFLYKKILPQNKLFSQWYGYSSFPKSKRDHLINILNKGNYDIVVSVHVFLSFHLASIKDRINLETIGWMHNSYDAFFKIDTGYVKHLYNFFKYQMKELSRIIVLSHNDSNLYRQKFGIHSQVIYNPLTILPDGKAQAEKKFLAIGRFSPLHKGFDILIKAFALFAEHDNEWTLDIVGDGPEKKYFESLIEKYALGNRILIHPFTKNVGAFYKKASVYILSSRWEGFGLVLLEAMSYGLPIIASELPVTKELLDSKGVGLFFQNENIEDLCQKMKNIAQMDNLELKKMSGNALAYSNYFSISKITEEWENLFIDLQNKESNTL